VASIVGMLDYICLYSSNLSLLRFWSSWWGLFDIFLYNTFGQLNTLKRTYVICSSGPERLAHVQVWSMCTCIQS